jgi:hypothetical protein
MSGQRSVVSTSLLEKLVKALDETWTKLHVALDQSPNDPKAFELKVHLAAEAADYSSFLFSLTYSLEDFDPMVKVNKKQEPIALMNDSVDPLQRARELREKSPKEAYTNLRIAAETLQVAYLNQVKKTRRNRDSV